MNTLQLRIIFGGGTEWQSQAVEKSQSNADTVLRRHLAHLRVSI